MYGSLSCACAESRASHLRGEAAGARITRNFGKHYADVRGDSHIDRSCRAPSVPQDDRLIKHDRIRQGVGTLRLRVVCPLTIHVEFQN
jgi:hypothetical protein